MEAVRIETTILRNGRVILENLPFEEGDTVEVIVSETNDNQPATVANPLKGSVLRYDDPFEAAVTFEDWEVLK